MSQYDVPFGQAPTVPPRTSGLAVASLVCSLILCCPITTVIGPLLGLAAIVSIGKNPARKGRGMAIAGIILGLIFSLMWGFFAYRGVQNYHVLRDAPMTALRPGLAGDIQTFKANFGPPGKAASDAEAQQFLAEVQARYGTLRESEVKWEEALKAMQGAKPGQTSFTLPWTLVFSNATVDAEFSMNQASQGGDEIIFDSILIHDSARGDLSFPAPASSTEGGGGGGK